MKALVLGGNGFIGSHLVDQLIEKGHSVRVFDRFPEKYRERLPNVDYRIEQFRDAFSIAEALIDIDVVYHLISSTVPGTSNINPIVDIKDNLVATLTLLNEMVKMGRKRLVFLSSGGTVYGNPERIPIPENHPLHPICSYGVIKVTIENYLFMYQHLYGLFPVILRPSNVYGPRQGHLGVQGVIATFLSKVLNDKPLIVWGDGSIIRDYLYVSDLTKICMLAGESNITGVFNAGYGEGYSLTTIIETITDIVGKRPEVIYDPKRSYDVDKVVLDISKTKKSFKWSPEISLRAGIDKQWQWIKQSKRRED